MLKVLKPVQKAVVALICAAVTVAPTTTHAAVTNCSHTTDTGTSGYHHGGCFGTTANPPYTTQWALFGECRNSAGTRQTVTSGWGNVGTTKFARCPKGWRGVAGTGYFLFR